MFQPTSKKEKKRREKTDARASEQIGGEKGKKHSQGNGLRKEKNLLSEGTRLLSGDAQTRNKLAIGLQEKSWKRRKT